MYRGPSQDWRTAIKERRTILFLFQLSSMVFYSYNTTALRGYSNWIFVHLPRISILWNPMIYKLVGSSSQKSGKVTQIQQSLCLCSACVFNGTKGECYSTLLSICIGFTWWNKTLKFSAVAQERGLELSSRKFWKNRVEVTYQTPDLRIPQDGMYVVAAFKEISHYCNCVI